MRVARGARRGLRRAGVEVILDVDGDGELVEAASVVKSPGVPADAPAIVAARERGLPVIGELELAWRVLPNRFVAVTGTNGKTTVTELLGHVWRTAGEPVAVAGNVGTPLASLVGELDPEATVVCEASSFQLEDADAFAPECAVLLNVDARPPRPPSRARRLPVREAPHLRQPGKRRRRRLQRLRPGARGVDLGGCARRVAFCAARDDREDCQAVIAGSVLDSGESRCWSSPSSP